MTAGASGAPFIQPPPLLLHPSAAIRRADPRPRQEHGNEHQHIEQHYTHVLTVMQAKELRTKKFGGLPVSNPISLPRPYNKSAYRFAVG